ncbi:hypothetical protein ACFOD4_10350 [Pseudoroseomonas globiformis]|uniref:Uncharacterized protein n=1 Tax=Teichococcus globiformis TaxID=2307229 RepID=A0ABV7FYH8_9PROT
MLIEACRAKCKTGETSSVISARGKVAAAAIFEFKGNTLPSLLHRQENLARMVLVAGTSV